MTGATWADWGIENLVGTLRPDDLCYVSLESALSEWGRISQHPLSWLTVVTTGEAERVVTSRGVIEFHHTDRSPADILARCVAVPGRPLPLATEELALEDLRHEDRNLNMVQEPDPD